MSFGAILVLALGLAMDGAAVAAARGSTAQTLRPRSVALVALLFGGFHVAMPLIGWLVGAQIGALLHGWDRWIAFAVLVVIGGKMLHQARNPTSSPSLDESTVFAVPVVTLLALATSLDALAVGITLPMLDAPVVISIATIGIVTAVASVVGLLVGHRSGRALGPRFAAGGGLVLIALGVKIVFEHLGG